VNGAVLTGAQNRTTCLLQALQQSRPGSPLVKIYTGSADVESALEGRSVGVSRRTPCQRSGGCKPIVPAST